MRKVFIAACMVLLCSGMLSTLSFAGKITLNPQSEIEWAIQDSEGRNIGTLRRMEEEDAYSVQMKDGQYLGIITKTGELQMPRRHPLLRPEEARLYIDVLDALPGLKKK